MTFALNDVMMMNDEIYLAKLITCSLRRLRYTVAAIVRDSPNTLYPIYIQKADVTSKIMKVEYMESVVTIQTKTILSALQDCILYAIVPNNKIYIPRVYELLWR